MKIEFTGGFHNCDPIRFIVKDKYRWDIENEFTKPLECLSKWQRQRIERHFCPNHKYCQCGGAWRAKWEIID